jgi:hypothetical protein
MFSWLEYFKYNPIHPLLNSGNLAIEYFVHRDILEEAVPEVSVIWNMDLPKKLIRKQTDAGFWKYPSQPRKEIRRKENYNQLETFRNLAILIEKFGFNNSHLVVKKAAEYLYKCQTEEGDFRGIYGNQYATTYTPAIMELLIKAGYGRDPHIEQGFKWLLSQRQDDGGWAIPLRTKKISYKDALKLDEPIQTDPTKPFSHLVTGMVLRAFAAHKKYRKSEEAKKAANLMISRLFKPDKYTDRRSIDFWTRVSYPFWFTDILTTLDSLSMMNYSIEAPEIRNSCDILVSKQKNNGLFDLKIVRGGDKDSKYWIGLIVSLIVKRLYENSL